MELYLAKQMKDMMSAIVERLRAYYNKRWKAVIILGITSLRNSLVKICCCPSVLRSMPLKNYTDFKSHLNEKNEDYQYYLILDLKQAEFWNTDVNIQFPLDTT